MAAVTGPTQRHQALQNTTATAALPAAQGPASSSSTPSPAISTSTSPAFCSCCPNNLEYLDYDYTYDDTSGKRKPQPYPRIRERGEYYIDTFNDQPWSCTFGTGEHVSTSMTQ